MINKAKHIINSTALGIIIPIQQNDPIIPHIVNTLCAPLIRVCKYRIRNYVHREISSKRRGW